MLPMQESSQPKYEAGTAIVRGTCSRPDLPWMNIVNNNNVTDTPLGELMALDFVGTTWRCIWTPHRNGHGGLLPLIKAFLRLAKEGRKRLYGALRAHYEAGSCGSKELHMAEKSLALGFHGEDGGLTMFIYEKKLQKLYASRTRTPLWPIHYNPVRRSNTVGL
jgi:hypothetical protein